MESIGVVLLVNAMIILSSEKVWAQQAYGGKRLFDCKDNSFESSGYSCNEAEYSCDTYAILHAEWPNYMSLSNFSRIFNVGMSELASSNYSSQESTKLQQGQPVLVPLKCTCTGKHSQANLKYKTSKGDTFYSLTLVFQGLTSCVAIQEQNPGFSGIYSLSIGDDILIPLRCSCPTTEQIRKGFKYLVSYAVKKGDTLDSIAEAFNTSRYDIMFANTLHGSNPTIFLQVSLLVPLKSVPIIHPAIQRQGKATPPPSGIPNGAQRRDRRKKRGLNIGAFIGIAAGTVALISVILVVLVLMVKKNRRTESLRKLPVLVEHKTTVIPMTEQEEKDDRKPNSKKLVLTSMADLAAASYTFEQIKKATDNFSPENRIKGSVYYGTLNGTSLVVKQTKSATSKEFKILQKLHHGNLIGLLGICTAYDVNNPGDHSYLVFEYAENGSLSDWLHGGLALKNKFISSCARFLTWDQRLHICLDVARGLQYIHTYTQPCCAHKDIKSSNILLDAAFKAKIANFGMAKSSEDDDVFTKHITGTFGYMSPEYLAHGMVTPMVDVYAFGVILLEVLSGRPVVMKNGTRTLLAETIGPLLESDNPVEELMAFMDPSLHEVYSLDQAITLAKLAKSCVEEVPNMRPTMDEINFRLSSLVQSSSNGEQM